MKPCALSLAGDLPSEQLEGSAVGIDHDVICRNHAGVLKLVASEAARHERPLLADQSRSACAAERRLPLHSGHQTATRCDDSISSDRPEPLLARRNLARVTRPG